MNCGGKEQGRIADKYNAPMDNWLELRSCEEYYQIKRYL